MSKPKRSPAYIGVQHTWHNTPGGSWDRINRSVNASLRLAIDSGQRFDLDDFRDFYVDFNGGFWLNGEEFYAQAVSCRNLSAAKSYETYRDRKPFIVDSHNGSRQRVAIGTRFPWKCEDVTVTSFVGKDDADGEAIIACSYHERKEGKHDNKVKRRFHITHADILADRKEGKERDVLYRRVQKAMDGWSNRRGQSLLKKYGIDPKAVSDQIALDTYRALADEAEAMAARTNTKGKTR